MDDEEENLKQLNSILETEDDANDAQEEIDRFINCNLSDNDDDNEDALDDSDDELPIDLDNANQDILKESQTESLNINICFEADLNSIVKYLTNEEVEIINSCQDKKLRQLLLMNRMKNLHLKEMQNKFYNLLKRCIDSLKKFTDDEDLNNTKVVNYQKRKLSKLKSPYFKVPGAPLYLNKGNTQSMIYQKYFYPDRKWTEVYTIKLRRSVCFQYRNNKIKEHQNELDKLTTIKKYCKDINKLDEINMKLAQEKLEIREFEKNKHSVIPPLNDDEYIDWNYVSENDLSGKYKPAECKAMWNMCVHPSINKSEWTDDENQKLKELAITYKTQNWETICNELGTNRSPLITCIHFNKMNHSYLYNVKFTADEDKRLAYVVQMFRFNNYIPWCKIARYFSDRTKEQLYHRYITSLQLPQKKMGGFSEEEDVLLLILVDRGISFLDMGKYFTYRTPIQLRGRYTNYLQLPNRRGFWEVSEDKKILKHAETHGPKKWRIMVNKEDGRNTAHIRHRYLKIRKWLSENPGKTIEEMPRKDRTPYLGVSNLKIVANYYQDKPLPSLQEIKTKLRLVGVKKQGRYPSAYVNPLVDDELVNFFKSSRKIRLAKVLNRTDMETVTNSVKSMLSVLEVALNVPSEEELKSNPHLDLVDKEVLADLFSVVYNEKSNGNPDGICTNKICFNRQKEIFYLPPNLNSLTGMRNYLIKVDEHKSKLMKETNKDTYVEVGSVMDKMFDRELEALDPLGRRLVLKEQNDFSERLEKIFKWPAVMSICPPPSGLSVRDTKSAEPAVVVKSKKPGRPKKDLHKIHLMNKSRMEKRKLKAEENADETPQREDDDDDDEMAEYEELPIDRSCLVKREFVVAHPLITDYATNYGENKYLKEETNQTVKIKKEINDEEIPSTSNVNFNKPTSVQRKLGRPKMKKITNLESSSLDVQNSDEKDRNPAKKMKIIDGDEWNKKIKELKDDISDLDATLDLKL